MKKPTKKELIARYLRSEPNLFIQMDGLRVKDQDNNLMQPDEDGLWFQARPTYELMEGIDVRILINPQTDRNDAIRMLEKLVTKIEREWTPLLEATRDELETNHGVNGIAESLIRIRGFRLEDFERLVQAARNKLVQKPKPSDDECPFW